jgi:exopolysaccharide biosynthesis polyprenyl glycosylphosphotransferase
MNMHVLAESVVGSTFPDRRQLEAVKLPHLDFSRCDRYFLEQLSREERRAIRSKAPLSLALIRLYKKKLPEYNKLQKLFKLLQKNARETDIVSYLGDDSIGVLLPGVDEKGTRKLKKRIKRIVSGKENFSFSFITRTYPDQLFHDLLAKKQETYITKLIEGINQPDIEKPLSTARSQRVEALSKSYFLERLRLEERRADRSKTTLSIALICLDNTKRGELGHIKEVFELPQDSMRETDTLGNLGEGIIGILLPDTNGQRLQEVKKRIVSRLKNLPLSIITRTYPDQLFDDLLKESRDRTFFYSVFLNGFRGPDRFGCSLKRCLDIVGSLVGIILFSPLMLITALAIKVNSPGPVFFKQTRMGKAGITFVCYKFRSMYWHADDRIHREYITHLIQGNLEEINQGNKEKPLYKLKSDPRISRVGRIIRKTSIDELPQLFNVLKGEMSLVGPRPPLLYEVEKYQSWHLMRVLNMKPGITGLWQVGGRSETTFDDMVRLDIRYIHNWSLLHDIKILFKTIKAVLRSSGAL